MKNIFIILLLFQVINYSQQSVIRVNQIGFKEDGIKSAVILSNLDHIPDKFILIDALTEEIKYESDNIREYSRQGNFINSFRIDFTEFSSEGAYYIKLDTIDSPIFRISNDVYNGTADFILNYMRQQRCGYNPFLDDSCHTKDGFIIYHPELDSTFIDVTGGWHDASDYLQYVTTSANAVYQMLFAYTKNPHSFKDNYNAEGRIGENGIPDILDEAKWGLDWLDKMFPNDTLMFNQIADDRDHRGFRLPTEDTVHYGKGKERPVYFITGEPQGVFKYKNRSNGKASTAGKFSSAMNLGSVLLKEYYPDFSEKIFQKSIKAYKIGIENPGVSQTAPCSAPYFYEEDNWSDDMELAAAQLFNSTKEKEYLDNAIKFGKMETTTPWMGADTASHYQWYPFINLGHYQLALLEGKDSIKTFTEYIRHGLFKIKERGENNPFNIGIPFIWCSNNLISAAITQAKLYRELTGSEEFLEMESSLLDWLFGCNPWGTSMIVGLPEYGDFPADPHSAFRHVYGYKINGGLVDGPVYSTIFNNLKGIKLSKKDDYEFYQMPNVVYHDDWGDYSTNEPTMDGTASLSYYLSSLESDNHPNKLETVHGGIIRTDTSKKEINLIFTGHEFADGAEIIISTLRKYNIKANFFFTGDFYRNANYARFIYDLKKDGNYLGAHSDKHLLYCDWTLRDSTLISEKKFLNDIRNNYKELNKFGIATTEAKYYMPPYEWYNSEISNWCNKLGLKIVNFTPGTYSNADYTIPEMNENYKNSEFIYNKILDFEKSRSNGLNGFNLLLHFGTHPERLDKFYYKLDNLISELLRRGYTFKLFNETINN